MSQQIAAAPPPARADGPPNARPSKDGDAPPGGFAEVLGAAETATSPPTPGDRPARTAHAEGTKAEGDSSGPKHPASRRRAALDAAAQIAAAPAAPALAAAIAKPDAPANAPSQPVPAAGIVARPVEASQPKAAPATKARPASGEQAAATQGAPGATTRPAPADQAARTQPSAHAAEAASSTLKPPPVDAKGRLERDPGPLPSPTVKTGGRRQRPGSPGRRLGHVPVTTLKTPREQPLRGLTPRAQAEGAPAKPSSGAGVSPQPVAASPVAPATATPATHASAPARATSRPQMARTHELAESMHALVRVANRRGVAAARITLRPAELGGVQVQLRSHSGGVTASLIAETRAGAEALGVSHGELRRSLEAQGIVVHGIDVHLAGSGLGPDGRGERWESLAQQMGAAAAPSEDEGEDGMPIEPSRLPDSGSQIDVLA